MVKMVAAGARRLSESARREQLLDLGLELFSKKSFDELSMDSIAAEAGVSKALLFHYFGSKRGYYVATVEEIARRVVDATAPASNLSFEETVERSLEGYLEFVKKNGALYRALVRGGVGVDPETHAILEAVRRLSVTRVLEQLKVKRASPLLRTAILGWVGFAETAVLDWYDHRAFSERRLIALLLDTLTAIARNR